MRDTMLNLKNNRLQKILLIISFVFLILALKIIADTSPAPGYELSLYGAYPAAFWIIFIGGIFAAILVLLLEVFIDEKTKIWIPALCAILMWNFIFILMPLFRGYLFIGGASADIFSHIGFIQEIINTGHVFENNFYPVIHVFILSLSNTSGLSLNTISWFVPALFWAAYVFFMFLLARIISKNKQQAFLITAFSTVLIYSSYHFSMHPSIFSFIFLPLLLYLYHKRNIAVKKIEITLLIIILCFFLVFFHPVTTIIAIVMFVTFIVSTFLLKRFKLFLRNSPVNVKVHNATNIVLILTISFFAWYTSHMGGLTAIKVIYQGMFSGSDASIASNYLSTLGAANLTMLQIARLFLLRYGAVIIYSLIAMLCLLLIAKKFLFLRKIKELEFSYSIQLIASFFASFAMMVGYAIVINPIRSSRYFLMMLTIFNGIVIYFIFEEKKKLKKKTIKKYCLPILLAFVLLFSCTVCIVNVYPSPTIWASNQQVTNMNFAGSVWISEKRDTTVQVAQCYGSNLWRMEHYMLGIKEGDERFSEKGSLDVATHFGYGENDTLLTVYDYSDTYLITTENSRQGVNAFPLNVQPIARQYTADDYRKLNSDTAVNKIYENGEHECWFVVD